MEAGSLCMGQEFVKAGNVPPWVGEVVLTAAAKVFSNSTQVDVSAPLPYFMNPVLAACQLVNIAKDGEQPDIWSAQEDMRLFSPELADRDGKLQPSCPSLCPVQFCSLFSACCMYASMVCCSESCLHEQLLCVFMT